MTAVTAVHGIPSGSLPLLLCLAKRQIALSVASVPAKRARGGTGNQVYSISLLNILLNIFTSLNLLQKINAHLILFNLLQVVQAKPSFLCVGQSEAVTPTTPLYLPHHTSTTSGPTTGSI